MVLGVSMITIKMWYLKNAFKLKSYKKKKRAQPLGCALFLFDCISTLI